MYTFKQIPLQRESIMKLTIILLTLAALSGCANIKYNGAERTTQKISYPNLGEIVTVYVGEHMLQKGTITEESVLIVNGTIEGALYDIPAGKYAQLGFDSNNEYYSPVGVVQGVIADPIKALSLGKQSNAKLCVVSVYGQSYCYQGDFEKGTQISERSNSFQQTLIYSGTIGSKINIGYREFSNNVARPAFNNDVEYDLSTSKTIGYKGALIEVIEANNSSITYKVIRNFP